MKYCTGLTRCLLFVCTLLFCGEVGAGDGRLKWFTIESEHFVITYPEPLEGSAQRLAQLAERAHQVLVPAIGHEPEDKTLVVIEDFQDGSNGFANVLPRNEIHLFASAPTSKSDLSDHDDWLYALFVHEYAHILHLDTIGGVPKWVNRIMGKTWAPNQVQPRWIIEGLATYEESLHTSGGRMRNSLFRTTMRTATLADDERDLGEMSNGPRAWPHGNTAYLYGSYFLQYIFQTYGDETVAKLAKAYGHYPFPYAIGRAFGKATGKGIEELYREWKGYRRDVFALESEAVERRGRREGRRLTFSSEININPKYSRDGTRIVWQVNTGMEEGHHAVMPSQGRPDQRQTYTVLKRAGEFDLLSDGSLIMEQSVAFRGVYGSQELFRWDRQTKRLEQLTKRKRIRDPAISPDERQVAFVMNDRGRRRLAVMDIVPEATPKILWEGIGDFNQAFDPAWSPDGREIAFSAWRAGGFRDILIVDLATGTIRELARDRAHDVDPVYSPDGQYLYYASDRSGIYNIYARDRQSGQLWQVTNVLGAATTPDISPDGKRMVYQGTVARGLELYELPLHPASWTEASLYINDRPEPIVVASSAKVSSRRPYQPLATLFPKRYELQWDPNTQGVSVQVNGEDVVGHHRFSLASTVKYGEGRFNLGGSYRYNKNWATLQIAASRNVRDRGGYIIDGRSSVFEEELWSATVGVRMPVLRTPRGSGTISLDYDFDYFRNIKDKYLGPDPNQTVPIRPDSDLVRSGVALRFGYSDLAGGAYTLGPQRGQSFNLAMRIDTPSIGAEYRSLALNYQYQTYYKLPWGQTPVLALRVDGGIQLSDRPRPSVFSLGGLPRQDLVQSLVDNLRVGHTGFLRGYGGGAAVGRQRHLVNMEYRQELWNLEWGVLTLPLYLKKLHFAGLLDAGNAFDGPLQLGDFKTAAGLSLRMDMLLGYFVPGALDIGYARGLNEGGIHQWWMLLTGTI